MADQAQTAGAAREALVADKLPARDAMVAAVREALVGDRLGTLPPVAAVSTIRETLIHEPPYRYANGLRESLVSRPGEDLFVARLARSIVETSAGRRDALPNPSKVWSTTTIGGLIPLAAVGRTVGPVHSTDMVGTLRDLTVQHRVTPGANGRYSLTSANTLKELVTRSRSVAYIPVSAAFVGALAQQTARYRLVLSASATRSSIRANAQHELVAQSRKAQLIKVDIFVGQAVTLASSKRAYTVPFGGVTASAQVMLTVQHRMMVSAINVRADHESMQVTQHRATEFPRSASKVSAQSQLAMQHRVSVQPHSASRVTLYQQLAAAKRALPVPAAMMGRSAATQAQQVTQTRALLTETQRRSAITAVTTMVQFNMGRTVTPPGGVVDPTLGLHVSVFQRLSVSSKRLDMPEDVVGKSRYVRSALAQAVLGDTGFVPPPWLDPDTQPVEPPNETPPTNETFIVGELAVLSDREGWEPVSALKAHAVAAQAVLEDTADWVDPMLPVSDLSLVQAAMHTAVGDPMPPPSSVTSDNELISLSAFAALGDSTLPPAYIVQSDASVGGAAQLPVFGDAGFPAAYIPQSDVSADLVVSAPVLGDGGLIGKFPASNTDLQVAIEVVAVRDPTMDRLPLRAPGPRPVVSISYS